ncbi:copper homeostasis protein CutC [Infundibulicybe gibba]|nr:copper homeostasis protein CutC [Infundibulicybe gibba]
MNIDESILIEVCVDSVASAKNAVRGGAGRLELCGSLGLGGGTTPSIGLLKAVQRAVNIPIMVMIRPRVGDFMYSEEEIEVMMEDVDAFRKHGVQGVVVGMLTADGRIDVERMKRFIDEAFALEICFHRAFDMTRDADEALRDIISIGGISRILTSGHAQSVPDGLPTLARLLESTRQLTKGEHRALSILPGSGIGPRSIGRILDALRPQGLREIHMSGGSWQDGGMKFQRAESLGMGVPDTNGASSGQQRRR